jgi:MerR family transcriptional regulator, copper efflux regulator
MAQETFHIGDVASRTGLSLRTVRYYESVGLVAPSGRTEGGFRLYTEPDVRRLLLVRSLKPADFPLEDLQALLETHDRLLEEPDPDVRRALEGRLAGFLGLARERLRLQRERLVASELALEVLEGALARSTPAEKAP